MESRGAVWICAAACLAGGVRGENWPCFRGPTGQGISTETNVPLYWGTNAGVVWKAAIAGIGASSPVVYGDRVFVTAATEEAGGRVLALERGSGKVVWDRVAFGSLAPNAMENSFAAATPATDGERVYAAFGDGSIAALDYTGAVLWTNREFQFLGEDGFGASPMIYGDTVIMCYDGSRSPVRRGKITGISWDKPVIVALEGKTGKVRWQGQRGLSRIAHVTPIVVREGQMDVLVSGAGDVVQGFKAKTGERLWWLTQSEGVVPSLAAGSGFLFAAAGLEKPIIRALRLGGRGDVRSARVAWEQREGVPTPPHLLYVEPYLFTITDQGVAACFLGATGEPLWEERVGGNHRAAPLFANGQIFFLSESGLTTVIAAGPKFEVLARNDLGERCVASGAISQGNFFIRAERHLYSLGSVQK